MATDFKLSEAINRGIYTHLTQDKVLVRVCISGDSLNLVGHIVMDSEKDLVLIDKTDSHPYIIPRSAVVSIIPQLVYKRAEDDKI